VAQEACRVDRGLHRGVEEHHRFLLAMRFGRIATIEADVAALDTRIGKRLLPYGAEMALLMTIAGIDCWVSTAMSLFVSAATLPPGPAFARPSRARGQAEEREYP
jgi:hypothetical protein